MKYFLILSINVCLIQWAGAQEPKAVKYTTENSTTEIRFMRNNIVRVLKYRGEKAPVKNSLVVPKNNGAEGKCSVKETADAFILQSGTLKALLNKTTGIVSFWHINRGRLLAESNAGQGFRKIDATVTHVSQSFNLSSDEAVYGLGQHQNGKMNQRNQSILLRQGNMDIGIPFLQSSKGYGIYWDNYSATIYSDKSNIMNLTSEAGNCIDYYFIAGENADEVIDGYRQLTGIAPMFPLWSFGYIQSRERYQHQDEVVGVVRKYRQLKVPIDAVVQDWQYWGNDNMNWNALQFDNPKYANAVAMIDNVHSMNAKIIISVWPSFGENSQIYKELNQKKLLFNFLTYPESKGVKVYDAFNPEARAIYWKYMNKNLFSKGIDAWWLDATEPEQKGAGADPVTDTFGTAVVKDVVTYWGNYRGYTNAYPLATVSGVYQNQRKTSGDKRVFILTRSAFAGQQKSAGMVWSGDITASWQTLKDQIPAALNYSLSGMPYWNADIGGFWTWQQYPQGVKDLAYQELYIRWLQFAVFTGMMRSHGTNTPREIYQFGKPGDIAFNIIRKYIGLRYQLQPYIYSTAWEVTAKNASLMRPLVMDYNSDKQVHDIGAEYLFGKSILVAPVTDSIFSRTAKAFDTVSTVKSKIYLPAGGWFDFNTGKRISGGKWVEPTYTLSQMPLFIKAGSIIPIAEEAQYSSIQNFKKLEINIYPGKDAVFSLYLDEGDNYNYEKGKYAIVKFRWNDKSKIFTVENRQGEFYGMPLYLQFKIRNTATHKTRVIKYNGIQMQVSM